MTHFIPYGRQSLDEADIQAVVDVLRGDWLTCGPSVEAFEQALCARTGAKHAIAVANGTAALHVAMLAAGIGPGDQVITSPNTFLASANCAEYVGAETDFADIDPLSHNLDPRQLAQGWTANTRAVVAVDFAGRPADMPSIAQAARKGGACVIEDAAHAIGGGFTFDGRTYQVGGHPWADMTTFSFHPVKTITAGEGGAVVTDDDALAARCRLFRNHGMVRNRPEEPWFYEMKQPGFNYRLTDIQSALALSQLGRLDAFLLRRQKIVDTYNEGLRNVEHLRTPSHVPAGEAAWHLYVVQIDFSSLGKSRAEAMRELRELGIGTQVHYIPVHLQTYYREKYGYAPGKCPTAEAYYERCLSLPLFPAMTSRDASRVIEAVKQVLR